MTGGWNVSLPLRTSKRSRFSNYGLTDLIVDGPLDRVDTIAGGRMVSGVSGVQDQDGTGERERALALIFLFPRSICDHKIKSCEEQGLRCGGKSWQSPGIFGVL